MLKRPGDASDTKSCLYIGMEITPLSAREPLGEPVGNKL